MLLKRTAKNGPRARQTLNTSSLAALKWLIRLPAIIVLPLSKKYVIICVFFFFSSPICYALWRVQEFDMMGGGGEDLVNLNNRKNHYILIRHNNHLSAIGCRPSTYF